MPTYEYECRNHGKIDVHKSSDFSDKEERCDVCGLVMIKQIGSNINTSGAAHRGVYYHAFGKHFDSRSQLKNEISKIEGETGKKIIELGSDGMDTVKRVKKTPDWAEATRALSHKLKHG